MTSFFLAVLAISATAAFVAVVVLIFRLILKSSPRWITCLLWGLVALRLICPSLPESKFSFIPDNPVKNSYYSENPVLPESDSSANISESEIMANAAVSDSQVNRPEYTEEVTGKSPASEPSHNNLTEIAFYVWVSGSAVMFVYGIISYVVTRFRFRDAVLLRDNIRQSEKVDSPFVMGFFKPQIFISFRLDRKTRKQVLLHEQAHISRLDHIWKPLGYLLLCIHWFNPLMWVSYILFCRDIEVACDEKVIKNYKMKQKKAYATALLNCKAPVRAFSASPIAFGEIGVGVRIKKTLKYKKPSAFIVVIGVVLTIALSVCLLTNPVSATENQEDITSSEITADSSIVQETSTEVTAEFVTETVTEQVTEPTTEPKVAIQTEPVTEAPVEYVEEYDDGYYDYSDYNYYNSDEYYETFVVPEPVIELQTPSWENNASNNFSSDSFGFASSNNPYGNGINPYEPIPVFNRPDYNSAINASPFNNRSVGPIKAQRW